MFWALFVCSTYLGFCPGAGLELNWAPLALVVLKEALERVWKIRQVCEVTT